MASSFFVKNKKVIIHCGSSHIFINTTSISSWLLPFFLLLANLGHKTLLGHFFVSSVGKKWNILLKPSFLTKTRALYMFCVYIIFWVYDMVGYNLISILPVAIVELQHTLFVPFSLSVCVCVYIYIYIYIYISFNTNLFVSIMIVLMMQLYVNIRPKHTCTTVIFICSLYFCVTQY